MKHLLRGLFIAVLIICCNFQSVFAQPMQQMPVDKNVRIGKLDNGLTYYIRHNALPEKRVEFYIAQKVGSILEEPQQRGLAHFLEHMAFNGTKHFPGDETGLGIIPWCETKGIKFGTNLNAYTSVDQTVYNISNVPTENQNVVDSCLLILHDWSSAINLADKEIDKERGVIREEWRSRNSGMLRIMTDAQATMYPDSKYADCMPIGSIDVINNFPYQDIRDYYAKWYRPDLQGIVIVGDINVDEIEAKLKKVFADVKAPVNPAERIYYPVADNQEPLIYIGTDKEVKNPYVNPYPLAEDEDRFIVYLSKEYLSAAEKAKRGYICVNIDDLFAADGKYKETFIDAQQTNTYTLFPSLNKFNFNFEGGFYGSNLQCKTGDMFIMRMAEVYLIAAEAEERLGNGAKAAEYLNVLRKRACRNEADFEANMKLTTATEDDVLDEYARELCGEFTRWALLKRHKAFETRLPKYNPRAAANFSQKNYLRPISYTFLNQIENSAEYGTNGY